MTVLGETTTVPTTNAIVVPPGGGTTTSLKVEGITAGTVGPQAVTVAPASQVLPFTGSNSMPLAGLGIVMLAAGFGLTRTRSKRRLAN
jgi:LPXTG-motif cell wall-anchored protein